MESSSLIPVEIIEKRILLIRNQKVILDKDLASLYDIQTKVLKQAVKRNIKRFPKDFMFELTTREYSSLRSQFVTLKRGQHSKYLPLVFTEQGVAMLSSVLNSERAVQVNIAIMRAFVKLREMLFSHKEFALKLKELERKIEQHHENIHTIFEAIRQLMKPPKKEKGKLGFTVEEKRGFYSATGKHLKSK